MVYYKQHGGQHRQECSTYARAIAFVESIKDTAKYIRIESIYLGAPPGR
jgi:hypothetical protein